MPVFYNVSFIMSNVSLEAFSTRILHVAVA